MFLSNLVRFAHCILQGEMTVWLKSLVHVPKGTDVMCESGNIIVMICILKKVYMQTSVFAVYFRYFFILT
jgi:hypothetical protein